MTRRFMVMKTTVGAVRNSEKSERKPPPPLFSAAVQRASGLAAIKL
jgi:hypothetical protein